MSVLIGVISDTHNLLRPEVLTALKRSKLIFHAGDVCRQEGLEELGRIAPIVAVRGNNDRGAWARRLPVSRT
ncbi:MAG TPA: metallophosphoesterase family protein, partial [Vicinamibacteria bacterium]|nr:metallophosphoesterase family protein [Vicinamibacteria bacterium]